MEQIKVMIVDDNINLVGMLKEYFNESDKIKIVAEAYNGDDGIQLLKEIKNDVDVLLLDLIMPKKDGIWFLKKMKTENIFVNTIVETSYNTPEVIKEVSEYGIKYFILKPYDLEDLEERILETTKKDETILHYSLESILSGLLHQLGIPSHIKGYQYLKDSIILIYNKPELIGGITKEVYPEIARMNNTTVSRVERAIRHAIEVGCNRSTPEVLNEYFGSSIHYEKDKPTNSEYIVTMAEKLKLENKSLRPVR